MQFQIRRGITQLGKQCVRGLDTLQGQLLLLGAARHLRTAPQAGDAVDDGQGLVRQRREPVLDQLLRARQIAPVGHGRSQRAARARAQRGVVESARELVGFTEQPARLVVAIALAEAAADGDQHRDAIGVALAVPLLDDFRGALEQLLHAHRCALGRRVGDQKVVQIVDRLGPGELAQRDVELRVGAIALGFRA